jgi:hypothetical protein
MTAYRRNLLSWHTSAWMIGEALETTGAAAML